MSRPEVSVVMPFAGERAAARAALQTLLALATMPGDQLILADNSGTAPLTPGVEVIAAAAERSPAHARNAGARHARGEWILFLDADCRAPRELIDAYFSRPVADDVGALAGEVAAGSDAATFVQRFGAARGFLRQAAHLEHPFRPRAAAANLMVRRATFDQVGGFFEGLRAAEDTDFSWRLQEAGWRIELRPEAAVEHRYRASLRELRQQWRGYAAGRAWLARRYPGFRPEPGLRRALARAMRAGARRPNDSPAGAPRLSGSGRARLPERAGNLALDALLGVEELAGLALSNRPRPDSRPRAKVVLVADRFPIAGDPLVDLAHAVDGARVEAAARPRSAVSPQASELPIDYREDDGAAARLLAAAALTARHPLRCARDRVRRSPGEPTLLELAPAIHRLQRDRSALVHSLSGGVTASTARRMAALAGKRLRRDGPR